MRRLCREIRGSFEHGVYLNASVVGSEFNPRITGVMFSAGRIQLKSHNWQGWRGPEVTPDNLDSFFDGYGRKIVASTIA
jgi:hypothetical protein